MECASLGIYSRSRYDLIKQRWLDEEWLCDVVTSRDGTASVRMRNTGFSLDLAGYSCFYDVFVYLCEHVLGMHHSSCFVRYYDKED